MNKGFTIIESLVAITILIIGVLGPMTAATRGITDGLYAQNQLIATHLAQEALELASIQIKNNPTGFLNDLGNCLVECAVVITPSDSVSFSFDPCPSFNDCKMAYCNTLTCSTPASAGFYKYGSGDGFVGPVFRRTLKVTSLGSNKQVLLEAKVTWFNKPGTAEKNVTLYRYAFNP